MPPRSDSTSRRLQSTYTASNADLRPAHLWTALGLLIASVGVAATLHAQYVIPAVLGQARAAAREEVDRHALGAHPTAVTRSELTRIQKTLDRIADKVNQ